MNIGLDGDDQAEAGAIVGEFNRRVRVLQQTYPTVTSRIRRRGFSRREALGLPISQHELGTARDFAPSWVSSPTPEQILAFQQRARALGLIAVDETTREKAARSGSVDWTGPHMHVQMFPAGRAPAPLYRAVGARPPRPFPND
jgi:hypothetical protein